MTVSVEQAIKDLQADKMISDLEETENVIASLVVYGIMLHGGSMQKVRDWILDSGKFDKGLFFAHFGKHWKNLEANGVIKDGLVYVSVLPEEEEFGIEFALLINVALGFISRGVTE